MARIVIDARIVASSTGRYVERLLHYLQHTDKINEYIVLLRPTERNFWKPSAKNFRVVEAPFADFSLSEQIGLYWLLRRLKPDLVHFVMPQFPLLYRGRFVSTIHDMTMLNFTHRKWYELWYRFKRLVFQHVFRQAVRRSVGVVAPTNYIKQQLSERFSIDARKIAVTHAAADRLAGHPQIYSPLDGKQFLLYVGQATPYKNLDRLVEAFAIVRYSHPTLHLAIVGKKTDWHKRLEARVLRERIGGVVFTDFVPDERLAWLYLHAEAFVFPSLSEGFGLPGLEAMVYGCPVLASGNSSMPEVYGDAALYFDPTLPEDIAEIINRLLSDKTERQKLIAAGKKRAAMYSWQRMADQTLKVYKKVMD